MQATSLVDTAPAVVTALLAVSVVIAVVGIGTSLSLSVIERSRELALMRALGLTRGQLRGMLAGESVLLAVVAATLGTALGLLYGITGPMSVFGRGARRRLTASGWAGAAQVRNEEARPAPPA